MVGFIINLEKLEYIVFLLYIKVYSGFNYIFIIFICFIFKHFFVSILLNLSLHI